MDITKLDKMSIVNLSAVYFGGEIYFKKDMSKASSKKKKKMRKVIEKKILPDIELSDEARKYIDKSVSDEDFFSVLSACDEYNDSLIAKRAEKHKEILSDFSEDVQEAFTFLLDEIAYADHVSFDGEKLIIPTEKTVAYKRSLCLTTVHPFPTDEHCTLFFEDTEFEKDGDVYTLTCRRQLESELNENSDEIITVSFTEAKTKTDVYRADRFYYSGPWETVIAICREIAEKHVFNENLLNEKEKALFPLINELRCLDHFANDEVTFVNFKKYVKKCAPKKVLSLLNNVETSKSSIYRKVKLLNRLTEKDCEPLWREIMRILSESQEGYPENIPEGCEEKLTGIRKTITEDLHRAGYSGEYPDFHKTAPISGLHLKTSHGQCYFVGFEKDVHRIIHCNEYTFFEAPEIQFLCGFSLKRKNNCIKDIYSCFFNCHGKRYCTEHVMSISEADDLPLYISAAVKRADCKKLNKKERENIGIYRTSIGKLLAIFLFCGTLFGALMIGFFMLACCIATALILDISAVPEMFSEMPWLQLFIFSAVAFGGCMAIFEGIAGKY